MSVTPLRSRRRRQPLRLPHECEWVEVGPEVIGRVLFLVERCERCRVRRAIRIASVADRTA